MKLTGFSKWERRTFGTCPEERCLEVLRRDILEDIISGVTCVDKIRRAFLWESTTSGYAFWLDVACRYIGKYFCDLDWETQNKLESILNGTKKHTR